MRSLAKFPRILNLSKIAPFVLELEGILISILPTGCRFSRMKSSIILSRLYSLAFVQMLCVDSTLKLPHIKQEYQDNEEVI